MATQQYKNLLGTAPVPLLGYRLVTTTLKMVLALSLWPVSVCLLQTLHMSVVLKAFSLASPSVYHTRHLHTDQVSGDSYQPNTYQIHHWGREGEGERAEHKRSVWRMKQTAQPHMAGMHNTCNWRNPVCHLEVHDCLSTADEHLFDFNLTNLT